MIDASLQALIDAPLSDPLKINLPMGRRPASRGSRPTYEGEFAPEKLTDAELRERRVDAYSKKLSAVLDYYAGTTVPFDRIAAHTKLDDVAVIRAMKARGREA